MTSDTEVSSFRDDLSFRTERRLKFRVLILGRANAGKTTILERVAGAAASEAEVWRNGVLLPSKIVQGQSERGLHTVDDEIRFPSRPGFVFHDSQGVESGSAKELYTLQQFVENRSSVTNIHEQLHAIWICIPLDESRELFEGETAPFFWSKGAAPVVVIFTKHDGALIKETSQILNQIMRDSLEPNVGRSAKREARGRADRLVEKRISDLEAKMRGLNRWVDIPAFLTTGVMERRTPDTDAKCQQLINLTEERLSGQTMKTLLCTVWGANLSRRGFWTIYWMLELNHRAAIKLGSGTPDVHKMLGNMVRNMMDDGGFFRFSYYDDGSHRAVPPQDGDESHRDQIARLQSLFSPIFRIHYPSLDDVETLTLAVLILVVMHAVHAEVLLLPQTSLENWISAIHSFLGRHHGVVQERVSTISSQVAVVVQDIKNKNIIPRLNTGGAWRFSEKEATMFATRLTQCVEDNLM